MNALPNIASCCPCKQDEMSKPCVILLFQTVCKGCHPSLSSRLALVSSHRMTRSFATKFCGLLSHFSYNPYRPYLDPELHRIPSRPATSPLVPTLLDLPKRSLHRFRRGLTEYLSAGAFMRHALRVAFPNRQLAHLGGLTSLR